MAGGSALDGGFCVVTGANGGIGREVAGGLMAAGGRVVLGCRSASRCADAKRELDSRGYPGSCHCSQVDLSDAASVRTFAAEVQRDARARGGLQLLVNNAGVMGCARDGPRPEDDGHLWPNHLGPFLLTHLLLPSLKPGARVVNVASRAHHQGSLTIEANPSGELCLRGRPWTWYHAYARSKLCNVLHAAELQRRLDASGRRVTTYAVSPGVVSTGIFSNIQWAPVRWIVAPLVRTFFQSPEQGATKVLQACTSPALEGRHALYLHNMKEATASAQARDPALAQQLWALSESLISRGR
eukprot:jgi/Tetstr1/423579/TSEL_014251.t1